MPEVVPRAKRTRGRPTCGWGPSAAGDYGTPAAFAHHRHACGKANARQDAHEETPFGDAGGDGRVRGELETRGALLRPPNLHRHRGADAASGAERGRLRLPLRARPCRRRGGARGDRADRAYAPVTRAPSFLRKAPPARRRVPTRASAPAPAPAAASRPPAAIRKRCRSRTWRRAGWRRQARWAGRDTAGTRPHAKLLLGQAQRVFRGRGGPPRRPVTWVVLGRC